MDNVKIIRLIRSTIDTKSIQCRSRCTKCDEIDNSCYDIVRPGLVSGKVAVWLYRGGERYSLDLPSILKGSVDGPV